LIAERGSVDSADRILQVVNGPDDRAGPGRASAAWFPTHHSAKANGRIAGKGSTSRFWHPAESGSGISPGMKIPSAAEESVRGMVGRSERG
jgi:hypothetical protein